MLKIQASELLPGDFIVDGDNHLYKKGSLVVGITFNNDFAKSIDFLLLYNGTLIQLACRVGIPILNVVRGE